MKRGDALRAGLRFYDNGRPCPLGHLPPVRYAVTGKCRECARGEGVRYKEKRAEHAATHSARNVARMTAWKAANRDRALALGAAYRERHNLELRARNVAYRKANPTEPIKRVVREARRRALKLKSRGSFTRADVEALLKAQRGRCAYCRKPLDGGHQVDHIVPLVLGGGSNPSNLQLVCRPCNSSKGAKHPITFARKLGLLL